MANVKINLLPSGNYNAKVYDYTTPDGKRKYKSITASSKGEVKRQIAIFLADREELHAEREKREDPDYMTVGEAIDRYIESKSNVLSPSTVRGYRTVRKSNLQTLMDKPLAELTPDDIQRAVNEEAGEHSPKTVRNAHGLLSAALEAYAPDIKLNTTLPMKVKPDISIPKEAEIVKLFDAAAGTDLELPLYLAACCGLRRSEVCGLKWSDVNIDAGTLTVSSAMVTDEEYRPVIKAPKTETSKRTIKLLPIVIDKLKEKRGDASSEFVITIRDYDIYNQFSRLCRTLGITHYRYHDLRHYCVSVMLSLNIPKNYIADYMGHATENMIDKVYGHIMAERKTTFEDELQRYFVKVIGANAT